MVCFTFLGALALALSSTLAAPTAESQLAHLDKRAASFSISYVRSCTPTVDGFPVCRSDPYVHFGSGLASCSDKTVPFYNNFCKAFGKIPTPVGDATWKAADGCKDGHPSGTKMGTLTHGNTVYKCFNADGHASDNCGGIEYTGNLVMKCHT